MSQLPESESVASLFLNHAQLDSKVRFDWSKDRFDHAIDHNKRSLISVVEGDAAEGHSESWPASPPIQQLSIESIEDREVALGVGCAGTSHWSLSVEPVEAGFRFDWACRSKESPAFLGTTYQARTGFDCQPESGAGVKSTEEYCVIVPDAELNKGDTIRWSYVVRFI